MRPNGEVRWLHRKSEVYRNPPLREPRLLVVYQDITERMRSQLALEENIAAQQRVARALNMLAASNELISHARSVGTLVLAACEAIVSAGGYAPAWLGAVQKYAEQRVTPVAFAPGTAEAEQYVREAEVCWSDTERGRGPTGRAIRERRTIVARDTTHDPDFAPWSARAQAYGIRSSLTYPLLEDGVPIYVLMVYSGSLDAFNDDEVELLERLGANLTSGILRLRAGEARAAAEQQTQIARRELQAVMDHTIDGLITLDQSGAILAFSQPAARIFGYAPEEVISAPITLLIPDYDPVLLSDTATDTLKSVGSSREVVGRRKDGGAFPIDLAIGQIPGPATERRFVWTVRDVTARKEAEQRLARAGHGGAGQYRQCRRA